MGREEGVKGVDCFEAVYWSGRCGGGGFAGYDVTEPVHGSAVGESLGAIVAMESWEVFFEVHLVAGGWAAKGEGQERVLPDDGETR